MNQPAVMYSPPEAVTSRAGMAAFVRHASEVLGRNFPGYEALHQWSVTDDTQFWSVFLDWIGLPVTGPRTPARTSGDIETALFFPHVGLNYAECVLRTMGADVESRPAIVALEESGMRDEISRQELRRRVFTIAHALAEHGLGPGDRVVAVARNTADTMTACLAVAAVGATWSSVAPDIGTEATLDRFRQLAPTCLVAHGTHVMHGNSRAQDAKLAALLHDLPSIRQVVALDDAAAVAASRPGVTVHRLRDLLSERPTDWAPIRRAFNHPLFILFSSGTTGKPKGIIHGAGGTLLEHAKEHLLHGDVRPSDRLYVHTTCGWMMWNWLLSALVTGATLVLYDGSVSWPEPDSLLRMLDTEDVTLFGTSPAYLEYLREAHIAPHDRFDFRSLRAIYSTGSVLHESLYDWVDAHFKHVPLQSISGGTDILGCFVQGNPLLPVYRGESQCVGLGLDVRAMVDGIASRAGRGELVCLNPFPSRPIALVDDPDGRRLHETYFSQHPGVWTHGDIVELTERGTARILGRSDGTLNCRGVRIGPAEIHGVVLGIPGITGALAVEQAAPREPGGSRIVLLLTLAPGHTLDRALTLRIKRELSQRASVNHVPGAVAVVREFPVTFNGKVSERAARDAVNGLAAGNSSALRNPACLDELRRHPDLQVPRPPADGGAA